MKLAFLGLCNRGAYFCPDGVARSACIFDACNHQLARTGRMVRDRFLNHSLVNLAALDFVAWQQRFATPARQHGRELPAEIQRVANAHVHAVAAKGRMQVASIANQESAARAIALRNQLVRCPFITAQNFDLEVHAKPQRLSNQHSRVKRGIAQLGAAKSPAVTRVQRGNDRGHFFVDQPVHHRWPEFVTFCQPRRAEDDVVVV